MIASVPLLAQNPETSTGAYDDQTLGVQKDGSSSTLSSAASPGNTSITVCNGGNFLIGEWVTVGNADLRQITNISSNTLTLNSGLSSSFSGGSCSPGTGARVDGRPNDKYHNRVAALLKYIMINGVSGGGIQTGTSLPGTCTAGATGMFILKTGSIGELYLCYDTNTWYKVINSGDPTANATVDLYPANDGTNYIGFTTGARTNPLRLKIPAADPNGQVQICAAPVAGVSTCTWTNLTQAAGVAYLTGVDTTGATAVTSALQAALNSNAGKTLQLPCGILQIDAPVTIPNNTRILGCGIPMYSGAGGTIIRAKASTTFTYMLGPSDISYAQNYESYFLDGFTVDANASNGAVMTETVIRAQKIFDPAYLQNLLVTNYTAGIPGIWVGPGWRTEGNGPIRIHNVWVTPGTNAPGIRITSYYSVTVSSATNATPIVIGLSQSHGLQDGEPIYVSGVGGNTSANGWKYAKVTGQDSSHVALYSDQPLTTAVAGNGAYTSGGTLAVEGYVENTWITNTTIETTGTQPGIQLDSITAGMLRGQHGSNIKCGSGGTGVCLDLKRAWNSSWDNIRIHKGTGQTQGIVLDANSYGNSFRDISGPGGYNTVNLIVDAQTSLTTASTQTRIAEYVQANNGENFIYINGNYRPVVGDSSGNPSTAQVLANFTGTKTSSYCASGAGTMVSCGGGGGGGGWRTYTFPLLGYNDTGAGSYPAWNMFNNAAGLSFNKVTGGSLPYIGFAGSGTPQIYTSWTIPEGITGSSIKFSLTAYDASGNGGSVGWGAGIKCYASGSSTSVDSTNTATSGAVSTIGYNNTLDIPDMTVTLPAACTAGAMAQVEVWRDNGVGSTGNIYALIRVSVKYQTSY